MCVLHRLLAEAWRRLVLRRKDKRGRVSILEEVKMLNLVSGEDFS